MHMARAPYGERRGIRPLAVISALAIMAMLRYHHPTSQSGFSRPVSLSHLGLMRDPCGAVQWNVPHELRRRLTAHIVDESGESPGYGEGRSYPIALSNVCIRARLPLALMGWQIVW